MFVLVFCVFFWVGEIIKIFVVKWYFLLVKYVILKNDFLDKFIEFKILYFKYFS